MKLLDYLKYGLNTAANDKTLRFAKPGLSGALGIANRFVNNGITPQTPSMSSTPTSIGPNTAANDKTPRFGALGIPNRFFNNRITPQTPSMSSTPTSIGIEGNKKDMSGMYGQDPTKSFNYAFPQQPQQSQAPTGPSQDDINYALDKIRNIKKYDSPFGVNQFGSDALDPSLSSEELTSQSISLNNHRNDIATGMSDPYSLGVKSGNAFSPEQLSGIERGLAKSIDPALDDYKARLQAKAQQESGSAKNPETNKFLSGMGGFDTDTIANSVGGTLPAGQKESFLAGYNYASDKNEYLSSFGINKMNATQQSKYFQSQDLAGAYSLAGQYADLVKNKIPGGFYGKTVQDVQKFLNKSKDPNYIKFNSIISSAQGPSRVDVTGVSMSPQELRLVNDYMVGSDDPIDSALIKMQLQGKILSKLAERAPLRSIGVRFPDLTLKDIEGGGSQSGQGGGNDSSQVRAQLQQALNNNTISQEDYDYALNSFGGSFKQVGGGTNQAIKGIDDALLRIARNEGNGRYDQLGPVVTSGTYKGERAIGRYQVMPGNVPAWTREALGYSMTPQQFTSSGQAQEAVARHQLMKSYKKYGNWSDVASVWFTGGPVAYGKNKKDVLGTTGQKYVDNFNS